MILARKLASLRMATYFDASPSRRGERSASDEIPLWSILRQARAMGKTAGGVSFCGSEISNNIALPWVNDQIRLQVGSDGYKDETMYM